MKHVHIFSFLFLFSVSISNTMENKQLQALPDWKAIHQTIMDDYKQYLKNQLEKYKKNNIDMNELITVGSMITQVKDVMPLLLDTNIHDSNGNRFIHIAVEKNDVSMVQWLLTNGDKNYLKKNYSNKKLPFDICISHLFPEEMRFEVYKKYKKEEVTPIFVHMISAIASLDYNYNDLKEECLKKIITLQLEYKKKYKNLSIDDALLQSLVPKEKLTQQPPLLSVMYKEVALDGNTWTHFLVNQEKADELYELVKQGRVSFAQNNAGKTALDLAIDQFRAMTQDNGKLATYVETKTFEKRRCCLYILLNYLKNKELGSSDPVVHFNHCCKKHILS